MRFHLNHRIKKFICGSMAVVVTVTGVFVMGMSYSNNAYAKATLQSIEGIIADASATDGNGEPINPFTILEVVPDVVSPTNNMVQNSNGEYLEVKLTYGTDTIPFTQNMGTAGYYIDGQEPIVYDLKKYLGDYAVTADGITKYYKTTVEDYTARKKLAERLLTVLEEKKWIGKDKNDATPLYKTGEYSEIRLGQYFPNGFFYDFNQDGDITNDEKYEVATEELIEKITKNQLYHKILHDYTGKTYNIGGTKKDAYLDVASGYMEAVAIGDGNFSLSYEPKLNSNNKVDTTNDSAYQMVSNAATTSVFSKISVVSDLEGEFDPYFISDDSNDGSSATHRATFAYVEGAKSGYRISNEPNAITDLTDVAIGTPLYVYDREIGQYVFAGFVDEVDGNKTVISPTDTDLVGLYYRTNAARTFSMRPFHVANQLDVELETETTTEETTTTEESSDVESFSTENASSENMTDESKESSSEDTSSESKELSSEDTSNESKESSGEDTSSESKESSGEDTSSESKELSNEDIPNESKEQKESSSSDDIVRCDYESLLKREVYVSMKQLLSRMPGNSDISDLTEAGYYILEFDYVPEGDGVSGLYQISFFDKGNGGMQYTVAKESSSGEPLPAIVPNESKTGTIQLVDASAVSSQMIYDYVEENGYYRFVESEWCTDAGYSIENYSIRGAQICFAVGLKNNEWFKQYALDRTIEQCQDVAIEVITMAARDVTVEDISGSDMLLLNQCDADICLAGSKATNYTRDSNDLTEKVCDAILERIVSNSYSVMADYGILGDKANNTLVNIEDANPDPNIFYLLKALSLNENKSALTSYYETYLMVNASNLAYEDPTDMFEGITANNYNFVNGSIYIFSGSHGASNPFSQMKYLNNEFYTVVSDDMVNAGFTDVLLDIKNENIYRKTAGLEESISEEISQATAIRYILGYAAKRGYEIKGNLSVLELEPCASYLLKVSHEYNEQDPNLVETGTITEKGDTQLISLEGSKIALTQMTTSEFIGRIEDINARYDMIYIGDSIGLMNRKDNITQYNDSSMNGLIYTNVGDSFKGQRKELNGLEELGNAESSEVVRCRFPGNDITEEKYNALCDYAKAGYPVVVADGLMYRDATTNQLVVNKNTVDCNSFLYKFLNKYKDKENVFIAAETSNSLLTMYVNLSRPSIELIESDGEDDELTDWYRATTDVVELDKDPDGFYRARYRFTVNNKGIAGSNTTFDCKLYVDINSDGKYSFTSEEIKDIYVTDYHGQEVSQDDKDRYELRAGKTYEVSYTLAKTFHGVIPWRLRITQNDETNLRRADVTGYYSVDSGRKKDIKVLQVDTGSGASSTWNMENDIAPNSKTVFKALLEDESVVPYNVDIRTISADKLTVSGTDSKFGYRKGIVDADGDNSISTAEYLTFFRKFDMLVLGYADTFRISNEEALEAVKLYAKEGRSVLFTHDTSSFFNAGNNWGVQYNKILRNLFGMDRYNIMDERKESDEDTFSIETAYKPGDENKSKVTEIQGYNYPMLYYREAGGNKYKYLTPMTYHYDNTYNTKYVEQVNNGQITMYPYILEKGRFEVSKTHAQYYQLDFSLDEDRDGESDIVVWYTLAGTNLYDTSPRDARNNYYIYNKGNVTYSGVGHSKVSTATVTTDKNGNVVVDADTKEINEIKLFINTLIAAYESGLHNPKVEVLEGYDEHSRDINSLYVSYDEQLKEITDDKVVGGVIDGVKDIYFMPESASLIRVDSNTTRNFSVQLYVEVPENTSGAKEMQIDGAIVYGKEIAIGTSDGATVGTYDNRLYRQNIVDGVEREVVVDKINGKYQLEPGVVYKTSIPISALSDFNNLIFQEDLSDEIQTEEAEVAGRNTRRIFVEATEAVVNEEAGTSTTASGYDTISVVRVQLFDLD